MHNHQGQEITTFLVDLDGTLVDTFEANLKAYQQAFLAENLDLTKEDYSEIFGLGFNEFINDRYPNLNSSQIMSIKKLKKEYYPNYFNLMKLNTSLVNFLNNFQENYKIALVTTSSKDNAINVLSHFGLNHLFNEKIFMDDVIKSKPSPEIYLKAIEKLQVKASECIAFEDSSHGALAAMEAGVSVIKIRIK